MKYLLIITTFCLAQTLWGQNRKDTLAVKQPEPLTLRSIDPVCRMRLRRGAVDSIDYKGVRYGFCDSICMKKFLKNPTLFAKD